MLEVHEVAGMSQELQNEIDADIDYLCQKVHGIREKLEQLLLLVRKQESLQSAGVVISQDVDPGFKHRIAQGILNRHFSSDIT